jgi:uncharacterized membrane protein
VSQSVYLRMILPIPLGKQICKQLNQPYEDLSGVLGNLARTVRGLLLSKEWLLDLYTSHGHNLRFFGAVIFGAAWFLTCSAIVILLLSVKDHAAPKKDKNLQIVATRSIVFVELCSMLLRVGIEDILCKL